MAKFGLWKGFSVLMVFVLVAGMGVALVSASPVEAVCSGNTVYVDASRPDDSGDGLSWATAKKTIQAGVSAVCSGGTVHVAAGNYNENVDVGTSLTLTGAGAGSTIVTALNSSDHVFHVTVSNVTIQGFTIQGATDPSMAGIRNGCTAGCTFRNNTIIGNDFGIDVSMSNDITIATNEVYNNSAEGIRLEDCNNCVVDSNVVHDNDVIHAGIWLHRSSGVQISNNEVYNEAYGIWLGASDDNTILNNNIHDNGDGIVITFGPISTSDNNKILGNSIVNNKAFTSGIHLTEGASGTVINFNIIVSNCSAPVLYGVFNGNASETVNAENNWWGANDGPSASPGSGDKVSANVDYDPWLVIGISANPDVIVTGGTTSTITADMTRNSAGQNTSAQGHIPDGTEIIFTTNTGSIGSTTATKTTTNGMATATLTPSAPSEATVCAEAPHGSEPPRAQYEVCTTVDFVAPPGSGVSPTTSTSPRSLNPPQMSVQYVSVRPQQTYANQPVTITTNVVNTGDEAGNLNVALKINGQLEQSRMVSVGPHGTQPIKFTVVKAQPGTYNVDIQGEIGSFTILGSGDTTGSKTGVLIALALIGILVIASLVILLVRRT